LKEANQDLVKFLELQVIEGEPFREIVEVEPNLSLDDAYLLQFELMRRRMERGDPLAGYKAAYTNYEIQRLRGRGVMVGQPPSIDVPGQRCDAEYRFSTSSGRAGNRGAAEG